MKKQLSFLMLKCIILFLSFGAPFQSTGQNKVASSSVSGKISTNPATYENNSVTDGNSLDGLTVLFENSYGQNRLKVAADMVIEKITQNPATSFSNKPNGKDNDGEAYVYLTPKYAGKVKSLTYHTRDLPDLVLNPLIKVVVSGKKLVIPALRRNVYEILSFELENGSEVFLKSNVTIADNEQIYTKNIFNLYCIDARIMKYQNTDKLLLEMEGSYKDAFEKVARVVKTKTYPNEMQIEDPSSSSPTKHGPFINTENAAPTACEGSSWTVVQIQPVVNQYYTLRMRNNCNPNIFLNFVCNSPHNGNGNSYIGEIFHYISGSACAGTLQLGPYNSAQMMYNLNSNNFDCYVPPPPPNCGNYNTVVSTRCNNGVSQELRMDACNNTQWFNAGNYCPVTEACNFTMVLSGQTTFCGSTDITATVGGTGGNGFTTYPAWYKPDGTLYASNTYQATLSESGTWKVMIFSPGTTCKLEKFITVTKLSTPTASLNVNTSLCAGAQQTITATGSTSGGADISWFKNGTYVQGGGATFAWAPQNGDIIKISATNLCGSASAEQIISVYNAIPPQPIATNPSCTTSSIFIGNANTSTMLYRFFNGSSWSAYGTTTSWSNLIPGLYKFQSKTINQACESNVVDYTLVSGGTPPTTSTLADATVCPNTVKTYTTTAVSGATYQWQFLSTTSGAVWTNLSEINDANGIATGVTSNTLNITLKNATWNNYKWRAVVSVGLCISQSNGATLSLSPAPTATLTAASTTACTGNNINLTPAVTGSGVAGEQFTYVWQYNKDNAGWNTWYTANGGTTWPGAFYGPVSAGSYLFRIVVSNSCGSATATSGAVVVSDPPTATLVPAATSACPGNNIGLTSTVTNAPAGAQYSYVWEYNKNNAGWIQWASGTQGAVWPSPSFNNASVGSYIFRITVTNACGTSTASTGTIVVASPVIAVSKTDATCTTFGSFTVNGLTANTAYTLFYTTSSTIQSNITSSASGTFTVSDLSAATYNNINVSTAAGCVSNSVNVTIGGNTNFLITVSGDQTPCSKGNTTLTASGASSYIWRSGSATGTVEGTNAILTVFPSIATNYFVTGTTGTCTDTKSILVQAPRPALTLTNITTICKGQSTTITADNGGVATYTYRWLAPASVLNATTPILNNQTPQTTTSYTVERTTPAGCKDTATSIVNVVNPPVLGVPGQTNAGCSGANDGTITINATSSTGNTLEYSITGNTWQLSNTFTNLAPGSYSVLVRNQNGFCLATSGASVLITRTAGPVSSIVGPAQRCANEEFRFDATNPVTGSTYTWSTSNSAAAGVAAPSINGGYNNASFLVTYQTNNPATTSRIETVTLKVALNGCTSTSTQQINVTQGIFAYGGPDTVVCRGGQLFLGALPSAAGPAGATFQWGPADKIQGTTTAAQFTTTGLIADQEYLLTVTDPNNGCTRTDRVIVTVNTARNPIANAGADATLSAGQTKVLGGTNTSVTDAASIVQYTWTTVSGLNGPTQISPDMYDPMPTFTMPAPASPYTYALEVRRQYRMSSSTPGLVCFSRDTVNIFKPTEVPDLTIFYTVNPPIIAGENVVVENRIVVREVLGISTTSVPVFVSLPLSPNYTLLPYEPTITSIIGSPVQNVNWIYSGITNNRYFFKYIGTALIGANSSSAFGFKIAYSSLKLSGKKYITATIFDGSGGENNIKNNTAGQTIKYNPIIAN